MNKYKLPSGAASIEAVVGFNTEKDFTIPISKKNIQSALMESLYVNLEQQQEIAEIKAMVNAYKDINYGNIMTVQRKIAEVSRKGQAQCLASVKADAVEEFVVYLDNEYRDALLIADIRDSQFNFTREQKS